MKKVLLALMLVVGLTALAACGSDSEEETEHAQGVLEDRIKVGNTAVTTGDFAFVGAPFVAGMEAYFNMINEDGGVLGRDIELIHESDGFDGEQGNTITQSMVEEEEVFAMVGHFGTPTVGATDEYLTTIGIPRVYYGTGTSLVYNEDATGLGERASFPVQPVYEFEGELMVARAVDQFDAQKIGLLYTGDENGLEIRSGMMSMADQLDVEVIDVLASTDDMEAEALSLVSEDVDVIVIGMNQFSAITGVTALLTAQNTVPTIVSYVAADTSFADYVFAALPSFDIYANAWVDLLNADGSPSDGYLTYVDEISKEHDNYDNNSFAIAGWIAAMVFVEGLNKLDPDEAITWETFIEAMEDGTLEYDLGADLDYRNGQRTGTQILSFLQMQYDADEEATYFDTVAPMEHIDDIVSRIEE